MWSYDLRSLDFSLSTAGGTNGKKKKEESVGQCDPS